MQAQHNRFVPRLRMFQRINASSFDRLKEEWELEPQAMARLMDAYITAAVATARSSRDELSKGQGTVVAQPIDPTVVSGRYASVLGIQKNQKHQCQPPQSSGHRPTESTQICQCISLLSAV